MNILYLTSGFNIGGVERCILILAKELKGENNIWVASKGGTALKWLENEGVQHLVIGDTNKKNIIETIKNIYLITKYIKKYNIDIIHSHHIMTTLYCKIISKFKKIRFVHTQHLCIQDKLYMTGKILNNTNIICVSNGAKEILLDKCKVKSDNMLTIYNTVEIRKTDNEVSEKIIQLKDKGYFVVAQINRLVDYKGIFDFVMAAERVCKNNSNIKFVMIGDGPEKEKLKDYINNKDLEESIFILGEQNNVIDYYKYINLVIISSYIEGLPLVPLEAFSQSIPVIGTNIPGTNEEIQNGINGLIVDIKNPESIAEKILYIYENKDKYKFMCGNAQKIYCEKFSKEKYISKHKNYYINLN